MVEVDFPENLKSGKLKIREAQNPGNPKSGKRKFLGNPNFRKPYVWEARNPGNIKSGKPKILAAKKPVSSKSRKP